APRFATSWALPLLRLIKDQSLSQLPDTSGQQQHNQEEDHRECARIADVVELECLPVDLEREYRALHSWPSVGQQQHDLEDLEGPGDHQHEDHQDRRRDLRHGDVPEASPCTGAVNTGCLEQFAWYCL